MSIWNKVFVGLIICVSFVFFYFAAQVLKTHEYWRSSAEKHKTKIAEYEKQAETIRYGAKGDESQPGLAKMQSAVYKALIGRGRVWYNCTPMKLDQNEQGIGVLVKTDKPDPNGIADKTILAIFDERAPKDGGRYIGQFIVKGVDEPNKQVVITPCRKLRPAAFQQLSQSKGPWTLCEIMPADDHEIFAGMTAEQLEQMLPKDSLDEYAKDGQDGFERKLRDYQFLFDTLDRQLSMLIEKRNTAARDKALMDEAVANAKKLVQLRQTEIGEMRKELAEMARQRDAVLAHEKALEAEVAARKEKINTLLEENRKLAAEIAKAQLEAVRRVDLRTASVK